MVGKFNIKSRSLFFRVIILVLLIITVFIFIYSLMTLLGGLVPVNSGRKIPSEGEIIYLMNNGYHIALALPRDSCSYGDIFDTPLTLSGSGGYYYFGWGEKQFYLGTPTVRNIDWFMALRALFTPSSAVLEVLYLPQIYNNQSGVSSLLVSAEELSALYQYIKNSIMDSKRFPEQISPNEIDQAFNGSIFFEASGSYSLFNTCNNWTSRGLKQSGLETHLWTPFTWGVE